MRIARYSANFIPRNPPVARRRRRRQHARRASGRRSPTSAFPSASARASAPSRDLELEAIYRDLVDTFVDYQTRVGLRAIERYPDADLVDDLHRAARRLRTPVPARPIRASRPTSRTRHRSAPARTRRRSPATRLSRDGLPGGERRRAARSSRRSAPMPRGRPKSNIIVVSDHGFETFHTAVNMNNVPREPGLRPGQGARGHLGPGRQHLHQPAGREPNGTVCRRGVPRAAGAGRRAPSERCVDTNPQLHERGTRACPSSTRSTARPVPADIATIPRSAAARASSSARTRATSSPSSPSATTSTAPRIPVVQRLGDPPVAAPLLSLPNFYGAHGYDPTAAQHERDLHRRRPRHPAGHA